eukprot:10675706-Ditylum_brightwellii.AAC.1
MHYVPSVVTVGVVVLGAVIALIVGVGSATLTATCACVGPSAFVGPRGSSLDTAVCCWHCISVIQHGVLLCASMCRATLLSCCEGLGRFVALDCLLLSPKDYLRLS